MRLTDERVREIEALTEKATPGPWIRSGVRLKLGGEDCLWVGPEHFNLFAVPIGRTPKDHAGALCDADFIAHARTDIPDLLADREALVVEIAELKTRMAERVAARYGQIENGAKMIAELRAENAKLRGVVEAVKSQTVDDLLSGPVVRHNNTHQDGWDCSLCSALAALETPNVPDATDDKR